MSTHPGMLIAYDQNGDILASLDHRVLYADDGTPLGLVDFLGHEEAGGEHTEVWRVDETDENGTKPAKGSKAWPEYLGASVLQFKVELEGPPGRKRIGALVHKESGHRRERVAIDDEITRRIAEKQAEADARATEIRASLPRRANGKFIKVPDVIVDPEPTDLRDLVGGPDRPLRLDEDGKTASPVVATRPNLPIVGVAATLASADQRTDNAPQQPEVK